MAKAKRLDGITHLTAKEKAERDARAQYWMNQRKIERVAEAAARSGWYTLRGQDIEDYMDDGSSLLDAEGNLIIVIPNDGYYRIEKHNFETDDYLVRKIMGYPPEENDGNN